MTIVILLLLIGVFVVLPIVIYNQLIRARNEYRNAFAQIQIQLKRRHDLIPNLVETTRAYLSHESETLEQVVLARNIASELLQHAKSGSPDAVQALADGEAALTAALRSLSIAVEAYPDLKANNTVQALHEELSSTENRVAFARQAYNDSATAYNNARETFPASLLASFFGHHQNVAMLSFDDHAAIQQAPKVSL